MNNKAVGSLIELIQGDLSNREFAQKADVESMCITRWKKGTRISLVDFAKLCKATDYNMSDVLKFYDFTKTKLQEDYKIPEACSSQIHTLLQEVLKLEALNQYKDDNETYISHLTSQIRSLREMIEKNR